MVGGGKSGGRGCIGCRWIGWRRLPRVGLVLVWSLSFEEADGEPGQADIILANSKFTARIFGAYFPSISQVPRVIYPGINVAAYEIVPDADDPDVREIYRCGFCLTAW
jgi:hypothetical protein